METLKLVLDVLQLNQTFFIYIVVFFFFLMLVSKLLINPSYERFLSREETVKGQILKAEAMKEKNLALREKYEKLVKEYNTEFQNALKKEEKVILQNQQNKVEQTRVQAQSMLSKAKQDFKKDFLLAKEKIDQEASKLARTFISKVENR